FQFRRSTTSGNVAGQSSSSRNRSSATTQLRINHMPLSVRPFSRMPSSISRSTTAVRFATISGGSASGTTRKPSRSKAACCCSVKIAGSICTNLLLAASDADHFLKAAVVEAVVAEAEGVEAPGFARRPQVADGEKSLLIQDLRLAVDHIGDA